MSVRRLFAPDGSDLTRGKVRLRGLLSLIGGPCFIAVVVGGAHLLLWIISDEFAWGYTPVSIGLLLIGLGFMVLTTTVGTFELVTGREFRVVLDWWDKQSGWFQVCFRTLIYLGVVAAIFYAIMK